MKILKYLRYLNVLEIELNINSGILKSKQNERIKFINETSEQKKKSPFFHQNENNILILDSLDYILSLHTLTDSVTEIPGCPGNPEYL